MCIYLAIVNTTYSFFYKVYFLHAITLYHFAEFAPRMNVFIFLPFKVKELVTIILILLAALGNLLFQVVDRSGERIEDANNLLLLGERGNWY